jgi:predicted RNase H-like HicB family nuclease
MKKATPYSMRIHWSDEDGCLIGTCPEFPQASGFGDSPIEAARELGTAIELAIQTHEEEGWPLPEPAVIKEYSGQLRLRLPRSMHAHLAARALAEGVSINTLIVAAVATTLGTKETTGPPPVVSRK